jgi:glycosyltransferase involved in cell wall biosynthesis
MTQHGPVEISVVVPVRDGASYLPALLNALDSQTLDSDRFEVIIVDDGSIDGSREIAGSWVDKDPLRKHLVVGEGRGPAYARNLGVECANGKWIASTDCDITPSPHWLEVALRALDETGAEAIEGAIDPWPPNAADGPSSLVFSNESGGRYNTGNMFYRRELLLRLGGFDEGFGEQFLEDSDLAFRILDEGFEIPFIADMRVRHPVVNRSAIEAIRAAKRLRWLARFAQKHPDRYWSDLRPVVRPLSHVDIDMLLSLAVLAAVPKARGVPRLALLAVVANGFRRGLSSKQVLSAPLEKRASRAFLSVAMPVAQSFWWLEGCVRFRKVVW